MVGYLGENFSLLHRRGGVIEVTQPCGVSLKSSTCQVGKQGLKLLNRSQAIVSQQLVTLTTTACKKDILV
jgi:hypothetical protein